MSTPREKILGRVKAALAPLSKRSPLPEWDAKLAERRAAIGLNNAAGRSDDTAKIPEVGDWTLFSERLRQLNGIPLLGEAMLAEWLAEAGGARGYCAPELRDRFEPWLLAPYFQVETTFDRARLNDYQFGITRASGAIAETGTVVLTDEDTPSRLAALAPWVHIAVVKRDQIMPTVASALVAMPADPNIIWVSGPSKTADVEGILIEGVHGPGQQVVLLVE